MMNTQPVSFSHEDDMHEYAKQASKVLNSDIRQFIEKLYQRGDSHQQSVCNFLLNTLDRMMETDLEDELKIYLDSFFDVIATLRQPEVIRLHVELDTDVFFNNVQSLTETLMNSKLNGQNADADTAYNQIKKAIDDFKARIDKVKRDLAEIDEVELRRILLERLMAMEDQLAAYWRHIESMREAPLDAVRSHGEMAMQEMKNIAAIAKTSGLPHNRMIDDVIVNARALFIIKHPPTLDERANAAYTEALKLMAGLASNVTAAGPIGNAILGLPSKVMTAHWAVSTAVSGKPDPKTANLSWKEKAKTAYHSAAQQVKKAGEWAGKNKEKTAALVIGVAAVISLVALFPIVGAIALTAWGIYGLYRVQETAVKLHKTESTHSQEVEKRLDKHESELGALRRGEHVEAGLKHSSTHGPLHVDLVKKLDDGKSHVASSASSQKFGIMSPPPKTPLPIEMDDLRAKKKVDDKKAKPTMASFDGVVDGDSDTESDSRKPSHPH